MGITALTPAMKQYVAIKEKYPDCILFYRMGDFYEMFFEDALVASKVLEITLTSRNKGKEDSVPLCGIPYHALSAYLNKLIEKGFKVAICEQVEDPKLAKGIVKREVVRVVTPGLLIDDDQLSAKENNFLAGIEASNGTIGMAFIDISTGDFRVLEATDRDFFLNELAALDIRELLIREDLKGSPVLKGIAALKHDCLINFLPVDYFAGEPAARLMETTFGPERLDGIRFETHPAAAAAAGAVLRYIGETQQSRISHVRAVEWHQTGNYLSLDENAKRNLELFATITDLRKKGSLFHILDETVTPMGGRRLRWWLHYPLVDPGKIDERLTAVGEIRDRHLCREELRKQLGGVYDLQRLGSRIAMNAANGRDLVALKSSLRRIPPIKEVLKDFGSPLLRTADTGLDEMRDIADLIERAILDDPSPALNEGGIIKPGYDEELDRIVSVMKDGKKWIVSLEEKERKRTGIPLRVGFNSVFGYYFEITKSNAHLAPADYVRKQTLVNAERYINQELKEYEETVLTAEDKRKARELQLFTEVRDRVGAEIGRIQSTAARIADLDALASLAEVAERYNYCRPVVDDGDLIDIRDGRHPAVERMSFTEGFVPNDTRLDCSADRFLIITGPNMAGKSTYIRQVALIVIMAQMGGFVPASEARIGISDRIFTRVGAADSLAKGQSTFMVEMTEVADILKRATPKSLVLLDEVGRGTSTFDGLSIAWAVAEYILDVKNLGARTLFATHYHQLTDMAVTMEGIKNYHIAVKEWGDRIIFLRKIVEGGTNRSYGIQVAKLAGVPEDVIRRAGEILENLETGEFDDVGMPKIARPKKEAVQKNPGQLSLFASPEDLIVRDLREFDLMNATPLDALNKIGEWKEKLKK